MDHICFDIETIPQQAPLSIIQEEELEKKMQWRIASTTTPKELDELRRKTMGTNPYFGEIVCIGMYRKNNTSGKMQEGETALVGTETQILDKFWSIISKFNGTYLSYNGLGFDVPFIKVRSMINTIKPTNTNFLNTKRFSAWPHHDVAMLLADWDKFKMVSLRLACEVMGIPSPKEGEIKAENVEQAFKDGNIQGIADYCSADTRTTYQLFDLQRQYMPKTKY